jgi:hypothetical protein
LLARDRVDGAALAAASSRWVSFETELVDD